MEVKALLFSMYARLYHDLITMLADLTDEQLEYSAPQIDTRSIRDVALHTYRPVLAVACVLAGEKWPARSQATTTKEELFDLFQMMHMRIDACIAHMASDKLEKSISLPWNQQQNGLEALIESIMHGMFHIGTIQGIRAFGGFPTPPEDPKPAHISF